MTGRTPQWVRIVPAVFTLAWGGNHFTPLLHIYEELGHYTSWQANLLLGTYVLGLIPGLLVASSLSDRHGRKPLVLFGMGSGIAASLLLTVGLHSFVVLCIGRALAGIGVGIAMSVGTSWMKELSSPPFDSRAGVEAGAKRPSLTLTLGFGFGAAVTGCLAQWGPLPTQIPYITHAALSLIALFPLMTTAESVKQNRLVSGPWWNDLRIPAAKHERFVRVIVPSAPWIFGAAGVAYAIMPSIAAPHLGDWTTVYATALTVVTLGIGAAVQPLVKPIDRVTGGRAILVGMTLMACGMGLAAVAALSENAVLPFVVAAVLGIAYGITVVAGLIQIQAIATPNDLAGLTGVYYSLAYLGFLLPALLAALLGIASYGTSLIAVTVLCLASLISLVFALRRRP